MSVVMQISSLQLAELPVTDARESYWCALILSVSHLLSAMLSSLLQKAGLRPSLALQSIVPRVLLVASVFGVGGPLLSAGSARATTFCSFGIAVVGVSDCSATVLTEGDKLLTFTDLTGLNGFDGTITLADLGYGGYYTVATQFTKTLGPGLSGSFEYDLQVLSPSNYFTGVRLTALRATGPSSVTKSEISSPSLFSDITVFGTGDNPPGDFAFLDIPGTVKLLNIRDSFKTGPYSGQPNPGSLISFTNTFRQSDVPGPLPLMGAGMAFGFSRKLRSRIKASAKA